MILWHKIAQISAQPRYIGVWKVIIEFLAFLSHAIRRCAFADDSHAWRGNNLELTKSGIPFPFQIFPTSDFVHSRKSFPYFVLPEKRRAPALCVCICVSAKGGANGKMWKMMRTHTHTHMPFFSLGFFSRPPLLRCVVAAPLCSGSIRWRLCVPIYRMPHSELSSCLIMMRII